MRADKERDMHFILKDVVDYVKSEGAVGFMMDLKAYHPSTYNELLSASPPDKQKAALLKARPDLIIIDDFGPLPTCEGMSDKIPPPEA